MTTREDVRKAMAQLSDAQVLEVVIEGMEAQIRELPYKDAVAAEYIKERLEKIKGQVEAVGPTPTS